eukprot:CAMPEP_0119370378 /NCGR_PEP_ID=MMETSP1334-20130426/16763_1 /TAXON_ID=127549 /ORGANISM="Calcidiscus leptoporus, Strain RCC1130" /LENGTH=82 /DNA_ID=CAMNT_0007387441 /DNA_START=252 /DNA_END=496 /DNA_ORIENTATION=-
MVDDERRAPVPPFVLRMLSRSASTPASEQESTSSSSNSTSSVPVKMEHASKMLESNGATVLSPDVFFGAGASATADSALHLP